MSARAVAVIRPAANIISRLAFLYILSGQGQLHASRYRSDRNRLQKVTETALEGDDRKAEKLAQGCAEK
jgi:hypothetical protein